MRPHPRNLTSVASSFQAAAHPHQAHQHRSLPPFHAVVAAPLTSGGLLPMPTSVGRPRRRRPEDRIPTRGAARRRRPSPHAAPWATTAPHSYATAGAVGPGCGHRQPRCRCLSALPPVDSRSVCVEAGDIIPAMALMVLVGVVQPSLLRL